MLHLPKCLFLLTASAQVQVEPVGRWFEAYIRRRNRNVSSSFQELEEEEESSEESADEEFQLEEYSMLRKLDPKDWKNQDHYAVLGLPHLRYKATQKQIKAARDPLLKKWIIFTLFGKWKSERCSFE
uniref:Uncharacterized protein n=1 Tax=Pundamilia nyererei TaxID=303518 RepID=A0A3B4GT57_9CICH